MSMHQYRSNSLGEQWQIERGSVSDISMSGGRNLTKSTTGVVYAFTSLDRGW
jgi:hypothetical protein